MYGRLAVIHSIDDCLDHYIDQLMREIVTATKSDSYEERACLRCFKRRVYDMQRGAWVVCEWCSGTGREVVYLYPKPKRRPR